MFRDRARLDLRRQPARHRSTTYGDGSKHLDQYQPVRRLKLSSRNEIRYGDRIRPDGEGMEPMPLKFALYPGCAAKGATPELYQSTMAVIGRLGIEVVELAASSCCGAGVIGEADPDLALALNARNLAQAERLGLDVMTICGTCQGVMSAANRRLKTEPATLAHINQILAQEGTTYGGGVQVKHLLWIAVRDIGLARVTETVRSP